MAAGGRGSALRLFPPEEAGGDRSGGARRHREASHGPGSAALGRRSRAGLTERDGWPGSGGLPRALPDPGRHPEGAGESLGLFPTEPPGATAVSEPARAEPRPAAAPGTAAAVGGCCSASGSREDEGARTEPGSPTGI